MPTQYFRLLYRLTLYFLHFFFFISPALRKPDELFSNASPPSPVCWPPHSTPKTCRRAKKRCIFFCVFLIRQFLQNTIFNEFPVPIPFYACYRFKFFNSTELLRTVINRYAHTVATAVNCLRRRRYNTLRLHFFFFSPPPSTLCPYHRNRFYSF